VKAVICEKFGNISDVRWKDVDDPNLNEEDILIRVLAAGVNYPDSLIVQGLYQFKPSVPFSPGHEGAGIIEKVGSRVSGFKEGDRVFFLTNYGAYSEKISIHYSQVFLLGPHISFEIGASTFMTYGTSFHALIQRANIDEKKDLLVLGASGGVGLAAIDIAKSFGCRVVAVVSNKEKASLCKKYGANKTIIVDDKQDEKALTDILKSEGSFDIIFDPVGGNLSLPALRTIKWGGVFLVVGFASKTIAKIPLNLPLLKGCNINGVFIGRFQKETPPLFLQNTKKILQMINEKKLNPHISVVENMENASRVLENIFNRKLVGKAVLVNKDILAH
jgi:NADPH2:quinone reductase